MISLKNLSFKVRIVLNNNILFLECQLSETPSHMIAAVLGEASALLFRSPFELIKQKMQMGNFSTINAAIKSIYQNEGGLIGLYRGYFITLFREIPFGLIQYPLYEQLKKRKKNCESVLYLSLCGLQAGGIAALLTTPIDVVKTRIMVSHTENEKRKIMQVVKRIMYNEGWTGFFSGVCMRVYYISIGGMIFFGVNEYMKRLLKVKMI